MRVFHREHAGRPIRAAWALEEVGVPYELVMVARGDEEHRGRHPLGRVPALEDDQGVIFESAAICLHVADLHPESGLIAEPGTHDRALIYQWSVFAPAELEPYLIEAAVHAQRDPERSASARKRFDAGAAAVSDALEEHEYLVAGRFSVADIMVGSALGWVARAGLADTLSENIRAYIARLTQRPAYERALERTTA
jgi:glutathione S-transferase